MSDITYEASKVNTALELLEQAKNVPFASTEAELGAGIGVVLGATGAEMVCNGGLRDIQNYVEASKEQINNLILKIETKKEEIEKFESGEEEEGKSWFAAGQLFLGNIANGFLSGAEGILDGFVSVGGAIAGTAAGVINKDWGQGIKNATGDFVNIDFADKVVGFDEDSFINLTGVANRSAISNDSWVMKGANIAGTVGAYVAGGYVCGGLLGKAAGAVAKAASGTGKVAKAAQILSSVGSKLAGTLPGRLVTPFAADATAAYLGGQGRATNTALENGATFDEAFGEGVKTGAAQAATAVVAGNVAKAVGKTAGKIFGKGGKAAANSTDEVVDAASKVGGNADDALAKAAGSIDDAASSTAIVPANAAGGAADDVAKKAAETFFSPAGDLETAVAEKGGSGLLSKIGQAIKTGAKTYAKGVATYPGAAFVGAQVGLQKNAENNAKIQSLGSDGEILDNDDGVVPPDNSEQIFEEDGSGGDSTYTYSGGGSSGGGGGAAAISTVGSSDGAPFKEKSSNKKNKNKKDTSDDKSTGNDETDTDDTVTDNSGEDQNTDVDTPTNDTTSGDTTTTDTPTTDTSTNGDNTNNSSTTTPSTDTPTTDNKPSTNNPLPGRPANEGSSTQSTGGSNYHTGGGYTSDSGYQETPVESLTDETVTPVEDNLLDDSTTSIEDVIKENYTKIPSSPDAITEPSSKGGSTIIPVIAGLSAAAAAGIGAKAYLDKKQNSDNGEEEDIETEEWSGEDTLNLEYDDNQTSEEYLDDEDDYGYQAQEAPVEKYDARSNEELADLQ